MNYWLICLPREDMDQCIKVGTFGLGRKNLVGQVREGDAIVCCAGKGDWKITALASATSDYYIDDKEIFLKEGFFPDRFDFAAKKLPANREVDLMVIIDQLSFVTNMNYWAVYFRNGIAKMNKHDWDLINKYTER